jgi:hypothetical protein
VIIKKSIMSCDGKLKVADEEEDHHLSNEQDEAMTCSVLCSLSSTEHPAAACCGEPQHCDDSALSIEDDDASDFPSSAANKIRRKLPITIPKCCPKQLQLPMFLTSKYSLDCFHREHNSTSNVEVRSNLRELVDFMFDLE